MDLRGIGANESQDPILARFAFKNSSELTLYFIEWGLCRSTCISRAASVGKVLFEFDIGKSSNRNYYGGLEDQPG